MGRQKGKISDRGRRGTLKNLLQRLRERLPPTPFVCINILLRRDVFTLLPAQRERFAKAAGLDRPVFVPAGALDIGMSGRHRRRNMVVSFADTKKWLRPLRSQATFVFINETVRLGRSYRDTMLYAQMTSGEKIRRQGSTDGRKYRAQLKTDDSIARYYERCVALARSIKRHGVMPLGAQAGDRFRARDGEDKDIGAAIDKTGRLFHYRRGKHRLAIAQVFGLKRVPVVVHFVSGPYLLRFIRKRDALWPSRLRAGIKKAVDHAVAEARREILSRPHRKPASLRTSAPMQKTAGPRSRALVEQPESSSDTAL